MRASGRCSTDYETCLASRSSSSRPTPYVGPVRSPAGPTGAQVVYHAAARSPLRTKPYRALPSLGVWVGDQIATDGLLARASDTPFCTTSPQLARDASRPRENEMLGRPLRLILFARGATSGH